MMNKFPGLLGYGGIIAIHADWPIYPFGIGWEIALRTFGAFPLGTAFYEVDDIDKCKLLINQDPTNLKTPYDYKYFHIALWHEDLIELKELGFVEGIDGKSDYEFKLMKFEKARKETGKLLKEDKKGNMISYFEDDKGKLHEVKYERPEPDEDEYLSAKNWVHIPNKINVTPKGQKKIVELSQRIEFSKEVNDLVAPLIQIKRYDTAVRDGALLLEASIKNFHNTNLYGQNLVSFHIDDIVKHNDNFFFRRNKVL